MKQWKWILSVILILSSIFLYITALLISGDVEHVIFYIIIDLAFIPLEVLIVVFVIEHIINKKEKETFLEKLDMIYGIFFSEIGNDLLIKISSINQDPLTKLCQIETWTKKDYNQAYKNLKNHNLKYKPYIPENEKDEFIFNLKNNLTNKKEFLIGLIANPSIIERESFSELLLAIFHLIDELELKIENENISIEDFNHIIEDDLGRVYCMLVYQWIKYLEFLDKNHPYMKSLAIKNNPFKN